MLLRRKGLFLQKRALSDVRPQGAGIKQLPQKESRPPYGKRPLSVLETEAPCCVSMKYTAFRRLDEKHSICL